eukprot:COSAG06_NODE_4727_length_3951_cov_2.075897_1_plen_165_part_00
MWLCFVMILFVAARIAMHYCTGGRTERWGTKHQDEQREEARNRTEPKPIKSKRNRTKIKRHQNGTKTTRDKTERTRTKSQTRPGNIGGETKKAHRSAGHMPFQSSDRARGSRGGQTQPSRALKHTRTHVLNSSVSCRVCVFLLHGSVPSLSGQTIQSPQQNATR